MNYEPPQPDLFAPESSGPAPALTIGFSMLPSKNDALALAGGRTGTGPLNKQWRERARGRAMDTVQPLGLPIKLYRYVQTKRTVTGKREIVTWLDGLATPMFDKVEIRLQVWRPDWAIWDVTNPWIGPIIDGFVDARILAKDDCFHVRKYSVEFMGVDSSMKFTAAEREKHKRNKLVKKNTLSLKRARYLFNFFPLAD